MKRTLLGLLVGCMTLAFASVAFAGENANAGISLHIASTPAKATRCVDNAPNFRGNGGKKIKTKGQPCQRGVAAFDVWVIVCNGSDSVGVAGLEFGLAYDAAFGSGADISSWTLCGDLDFTSGDFPASGGGNIVTWEPSLNCQGTPFPGDSDLEPKSRVQAIAGVLRVISYGQSQIEVIPRPVSGALKVASCAAVEDDITNAATPRGGIATFCTNRHGYNWCDAFKLYTEPTTWGAIKGQYSN